MFSKEQVESIDRDYFIIISATSGCIVIQSKNTGHLWAISGAGYGDQVILLHKHKVTDPWHRQMFYIKCRHNLEGAYQAIKSHDEHYLSQSHRRRDGNGKRRSQSEGL